MADFYDINPDEIKWDELPCLVPLYVQREDQGGDADKRAEFEKTIRRQFSGAAGERIAQSSSAEELREWILEAVVEAWADRNATRIGRPGPWDQGDWEAGEPGLHGGVVDRVRWFDANQPLEKPPVEGAPPFEPIDPGDLMKQVAGRLEQRGLWDGQAWDPDNPTAIEGVRVALPGCDIAQIDAVGLMLPARIFAPGIRVGGDASFDGARIGGDAWFKDARVCGDALFRGARVGGDASFYKARVGRDAWFEDARVGGDARFEDARVSWHASFEDARVGGGASFLNTRVGGDAWFEDARVSWHASFEDARVGGGASFEDARVGGGASFLNTRVGGDARFKNTRVGWHASFEDARVGGNASFAGATFAKQTSYSGARFWDGRIQGTASFQTASFGQLPNDAPRFGAPWPDSASSARTGSRIGFIKAVWRRLCARRRSLPFMKNSGRKPFATWGFARVFGEMDILARASITMLPLVPTLAAVWPSLHSSADRFQIDPPEVLPWAWVLLFFAALFVVIGRMIYRAACPELIRGRSRFQFIQDEMEEFRRTRDRERDSRLLEAVLAVKQAGQDERLKLARHPDLVSFNGRTYWVPERLEDFEYEPQDHPKSFFLAEEDEEEKHDAEEPPADDDPEANDDAEEEMVRTADPVIAQTTREDIVIQAGAEARYELATLDKPWLARVALWLYAAAFILILKLLVHQGLVLLLESGDWGIWFAGLFTALLNLGWFWGTGGAAFILLWWLWDAIWGPNDSPESMGL